MSKSPMIHIASPCLDDAELEALREPLATGWLTQGPKVAAFEQRFAAFHQVDHAVATTSCTTALHLALAALDLQPDDEVLVPAFTWIATANVVCYCGATPVFVDICPDSFNMDPADVAKRVTPRTKAIIAVHLFGLCADMDAIAAAAPGIPILEDAACAAGATYNGQFAGALGMAGAFSFHPRKIITTGEGGMVTTNDDALAEQMRCLRNHGASISEEARHLGPKPYILPAFNVLGFNYRMTDLQGAVGLAQMDKLAGLLSERRERARWYDEQFSGIPWLHTPAVAAEYEHSYQSYVCRVDESRAPMKRNELMEFLQENGVSTRPGTHAVHLTEYYASRLSLKPEDYPVAAACDHDSLAIPLHGRMTDDDYRRIVTLLHQIDGTA